MNLTIDPWIPVLWDNGKSGSASLSSIFLRGHEIRDLAVRPHERIALMRLFLCVAHAALDGPKNRDEREECLARLPQAAANYLTCWREAFELFGKGTRFLQVAKLVPAKVDTEDEGNSASKLDLALATGNNPTLFDNSGGAGRAFSSADLALMLLTFQCYSPCGTIGVALWNGKPTLGWAKHPKPSPGQSAHAPCLPNNMLHACPRGLHLIETLGLNLLTREDVLLVPGIRQWGKPVWENPPSSPADEAAVANATTSYLGRLVPLSRALRLTDDCRSLVLANGLNYPSWPEVREPSASVQVREIKGKPERLLVSASLDKAPWRELNAITVKTVAANTNGGPLALNNLDGEKPFDLWVGGLVAAGNNKILDVIEAVYHVPSAMLATTGQRRYEDGVRFAENVGHNLKRAVGIYHRELGDKLDRPEVRGRRDAIQTKATFQFWTDAERNVPTLLAAVVSDSPLANVSDWAQTDWGRAVNRAARDAYEASCPRETARQLQAFVKGLAVLFPKSKNQITESTT